MAPFKRKAPVVEVLAGFYEGPRSFAPRKLTRMDKTGRIRACYRHACLKVRGYQDRLANTSLRERFGIEKKNSATASRIINDAVEAGVIVPYDLETSKRYMKYVPWWASVRAGGPEGD